MQLFFFFFRQLISYKECTNDYCDVLMSEDIFSESILYMRFSHLDNCLSFTNFSAKNLLSMKFYLFTIKNALMTIVMYWCIDFSESILYMHFSHLDNCLCFTNFSAKNLLSMKFYLFTIKNALMTIVMYWCIDFSESILYMHFSHLDNCLCSTNFSV